MLRVDPLVRPHALYRVAATREIEKAAQAALPAHTLMQRAGEAVARLAMAVAPHARVFEAWCGPGNNGGDGLEAAMRLRQAGREVRVVLLADPARFPADALASYERARRAGVPMQSDLPAAVEAGSLRIDALLGLGANRPPQGALLAAIRALRAGAAPVLAVDLPSGLDADTGAVLGEAVVQAAHTLALLQLKPGLFTAQGRDAAGTVWWSDLGVEAPAGVPDAWLAGGVAVQASRRALHASHKGSFGDVQVIGGAAGLGGAAVLAARASLAAGAGRVYLQPLDPSATMPDPSRPELMHRALLHGVASPMDGATVLCGCGGGESVRHSLPAVLSGARRLVLDADALNALAADPALQTLLRARANKGRPTVLTPHPLEAARLLGSDAATVQADRLAAAARLADLYRVVVVLKGSGTVTAAPGEVPSINPTGSAALATAGTGDVLAGWLAGRWAGAADESTATAVEVAVAAVFRHGLAAQGAVAPLRAADLIEAMHALG